MTEEKHFPKYVFWLLILLAASVVVNVLQYRHNNQPIDPETTVKVEALNKTAETAKASIDTTNAGLLKRSNDRKESAIKTVNNTKDEKYQKTTYPDSAFKRIAVEVARSSVSE